MEQHHHHGVDNDHDHDDEVVEADSSSNPSSSTIDASVRRALDAVDIDNATENHPLALDIQMVQLMDELNAQYIVDFLQQRRQHHHNAVDEEDDTPGVINALTMSYFDFSPRAAEVFAAYFASPSSSAVYKVHLIGELGNENAATILSGLQQNPSVTELALCAVGLQGAVGGEHIATYLLNDGNPHLNELICGNLALGPQAAHALRPALLAVNCCTLHTLCLFGCQLGDKGVAVIVDAIVGGQQEAGGDCWNNGIRYLSLSENDLTSDCIAHLARLLYFHDKLERLDLGTNPLLFQADDENKTRPFFQAISSLARGATAMLRRLLLSYCQMPGPAMIALFRALASGDDKNSSSMMSCTLTELEVYDHVQLSQEERHRLLDIIPQVQNVVALRINLDFTNAAVLSSFSLNSSIQHLFTGGIREITEGPIFVTMQRNRNLWYVNRLLHRDHHHHHLRHHHHHHHEDEPCSNEEPIPAAAFGDSIWAKAIERLAQDNSTGASATYKILCEQLPSKWWLPHHQHRHHVNYNNIVNVDVHFNDDSNSMNVAAVDYSCRQEETCCDWVPSFLFW
jgi:hypothetical protein